MYIIKTDRNINIAQYVSGILVIFNLYGTILFLMYGLWTNLTYSLVTTLLLTALTFGLYKRNKISAILLPIYYAASVIYRYISAYNTPKRLSLITIIVSIIILYILIQGAVGIFNTKKEI